MFSKMKISTSTKDLYREISEQSGGERLRSQTFCERKHRADRRDEMPNGYEESIRKGAGRPVDVRLARTGTEWRNESCEVL